MVEISGSYQHVKNENFIEYLIGHGIPEETAGAIDSLKPKLQVAIDGKKISLNSDSGVQNASSNLILDEEVDEPIPNNVVLKSVATLDGNILVVKSRTETGQIGDRIYQFWDGGLILTMTSNNPNIPICRRHYKRV